MNARRVVAGHAPDGTTDFTSDELVEPLAPGIWALWAAEGTPSLPAEPADVSGEGLYPAPGGYRASLFTLPPQPPAAEADQEGSPFAMHETDTVDLAFVIDGEVGVVLESGKSVTLSAGDLLVQNGARHAWSNHSGRPARILCFFVGAERKDAGR